jgi:hypothetical protein
MNLYIVMSTQKRTTANSCSAIPLETTYEEPFDEKSIIADLCRSLFWASRFWAGIDPG